MKKKEYNNFLDNTLFIEWQLTQSDELAEYWQQYVEKHPEEEEAINIAIEKCKSIRLNDKKLSEHQIKKLWNTIERDVNLAKRRRKTTTISVLSAAASIALLIASVLFIQNRKETTFAQNIVDETIVGERLPDNSLQLFSGNNVVKFDTNVHLIVDKNNTIIAESDESVEKKIIPVSEEMNRLFVPYGRRGTLTLSDGTKVWLNSGTELEFPSTFASNERRITVNGEIYIEVAEDRTAPFWVHTARFDVKVLGTKFSLVAFENSPEQSIVLVDGRVEVQIDNTSMILSSNNRLTISPDRICKSVVNPTNYISWRENILVLNNISIADILRRIERYYNYSFNISENVELSQKTISGRLFLSDNIDDIMASLSVLSSTTVRREGNNIYITQ